MLWLLSGAIAVVSAFLYRPNDWVGFASLVVAPGIWGALFLGGVIFAGGPFAGGIVSTVVYWAFGGLAMIISGMVGDHDQDRREVRVG
jgi:hypothetical protein